MRAGLDMEINVGRFDATLRTLLAVLALAFSLALTDYIALSLILAVVAILLVGTALTRKCPAYTLLGLSTCPEPAAKPEPTRAAAAPAPTADAARPVVKVAK